MIDESNATAVLARVTRRFEFMPTPYVLPKFHKLGTQVG